MASFTQIFSFQTYTHGWTVFLRVLAGAGAGSLFGSYFLQGEFHRANQQVQERLQALSKLLK